MSRPSLKTPLRKIYYGVKRWKDRWLRWRKKTRRSIAAVFDPKNRKPGLTKADISNILGTHVAGSSYLEVATRTTGHMYKAVSREVFSSLNRIMYNMVDGDDDRSADLTGEPQLEELLEAGAQFDVVFVDPYHSFEASMINLDYGIRLVKSGGAMVVHDCNPPKKKLTTSEFQDDMWLGVTYLAFLDFVSSRPELDYFVVDTDWGVGVVFEKTRRWSQMQDVPPRMDLSSLDYHDWRVFSNNRNELLRLVSVEKFRRLFE